MVVRASRKVRRRRVVVLPWEVENFTLGLSRPACVGSHLEGSLFPHHQN